MTIINDDCAGRLNVINATTFLLNDDCIFLVLMMHMFAQKYLKTMHNLTMLKVYY